MSSIAKMSNVSMLPLFYLGRWLPRIDIDNRNITGSLSALPPQEREPQFILLVNDDNAASYVDSLKQALPDLAFEAEITPSLIDNLMFFLNPRHNKNEALLIYRNGEVPKQGE